MITFIVIYAIYESTLQDDYVIQKIKLYLPLILLMALVIFNMFVIFPSSLLSFLNLGNKFRKTFNSKQRSKKPIYNSLKIIHTVKLIRKKKIQCLICIPLFLLIHKLIQNNF